MQTYGQTAASAVWSLTADQSVIVTGNVSGANQALSNMQVSYASGAQRCSPAGTAGAWPADAGEVTTRYMQYAVSPISGNSFNVSALSIILYSSAGSSMKANVYYSTDSSFATKTQIGTTFSLGNTALTAPNVNASPNTTVNNGETFYVRIYPWYTAATTTKYVIAKTVTISGTTGSVNAVLTSTNSLTGFVQASSAPSGSQTYTLTGTNLTNNVVITAPARFEISTDAGTSWNGSSSPVTLPVSGGIVAGQPITVSVRMNTTGAGTYVDTIRNTSSGSQSSVIAVSGVVVAQEPTTASAVSFGTVTGNSIVANFIGGNGSNRIVVAREASAVNWTPTDRQAVLGQNTDFSLATDLGSGNKLVYDGTGNTVTVTGLKSNVTYFFAVYEYNTGGSSTQNYLTTSAGTGSQVTVRVSSLLAEPSVLSFGNGVINKDSITLSYKLSGDFLTAGGGIITITATNGYLVSLASTTGYAAAIQVPYSGETLPSTTIYVRFVPTVTGAYPGSITNIGGGAQATSVTVSGNAVPVFIETNAPVGFASVGAGTTGGKGGSVVTITDAQTLADLMNLRQKGVTTPLIIYISGMITGYSTEISVKRTANISIIGVGPNSGFQGFGMKIWDCSNVLVRNMNFRDCKVAEGDAIAVDGGTNIWIDHCSFTDDPSAFDVAGHDGQTDVKNSAQWVTVSYNHYQNHRKTCLLGHTPSQTSDTALKVTYYRNWFDGTYSRHPRVRFARAHVLNNLYSNTGVVGADAGGYGVGITCIAQVLLEANYFENTPKPVLISTINDPGQTLSGDPAGYIKCTNNFLSNSGAVVENLTGYTFDPLSYYNYTAADAQLVKDIVKGNAGAGIIDLTTDVETAPVTKAHAFSLSQNYPNPFNPTTRINYEITGAANHVTLKVYNVLGKEVATLVNDTKAAGQYSVEFSGAGLASGIYFYCLEAGANTQIKKMILMK